MPRKEAIINFKANINVDKNASKKVSDTLSKEVKIKANIDTSTIFEQANSIKKAMASITSEMSGLSGIRNIDFGKSWINFDGIRDATDLAVYNYKKAMEEAAVASAKQRREEEELLKTQDRLNTSIENVNKKLTKTKDTIKTSEWNNLNESLANYQSKMEEILASDMGAAEKSKAFKLLRSEVLSLGRDTDNAAISQKSLGKEISNNIAKFTKWGIASTIVTKIVQLLMKMLQTVVQLDKAFTSIQMVTGYNNEQIQELKNNYSELAQSLKVSTAEVASAGEEWLRQGLSIEDTNTALVASIKFAKVAAISTTEATNLLTSAMKGYGLQVQSLLSISDKLNAVDMAAAVSASDLAKAMSETAASAKSAGIQMDTLIGYLATMQEVTQDSAESIGNS